MANIELLRKYDDIRDSLKHLEADSKYKECIINTKEFIRLIKTNRCCRYDRWFAYTELARCYCQLNKLDIAVTMI